MNEVSCFQISVTYYSGKPRLTERIVVINFSSQNLIISPSIVYVFSSSFVTFLELNTKQ